MVKRILLTGILLVLITACKGGSPSGASKVVSGSGSASKGDEQTLNKGGGVARQAGKGKLDLLLMYTDSLGDGEVTIKDEGVSPFTITQKQQGGAAVFNEFIIEGQGKTLSTLSTTSQNCTEESRTNGITTLSGNMNGGLNPDAKDACLLLIKVEVFYEARTTYLSKCPWSSATTGPENYAFDLRLPLLNNYIRTFLVPGTVWQLNNVKLIDLQLDEALTGCKLLTEP
jgi:hypothetical protein